MASYDFVTVDVFTTTRFGGNPLAVFPDARGLTDAQMQALAAEFNLSETTFVLPPEQPGSTARVRIFNRTAEMPFAGHPMVGTGYVLAKAGRATDGVLVFEVPAGLVRVEVAYADGQPAGGVIAAPRPLTTEPSLSPGQVAACASLDEADVVLASHAPVLASVGIPFVIAETTPEALTRAQPDVEAFRRCVAADPQLGDRLALHLYAWEDGALRARMFAPPSGTVEDPATGSANATLAALLLSLTDAESASFQVTQGVEMGRPSRLSLTARRTPEGVRATVGGSCVPVLSGKAEV